MPTAANTQAIAKSIQPIILSLLDRFMVRLALLKVVGNNSSIARNEDVYKQTEENCRLNRPHDRHRHERRLEDQCGIGNGSEDRINDERPRSRPLRLFDQLLQVQKRGNPRERHDGSKDEHARDHTALRRGTLSPIVIRMSVDHHVDEPGGRIPS